MARGRKADPTRAKRGTGHRPAGVSSPAKSEPAAIMLAGDQPPPPPADLTHPHAIEVWNAVVPELWPRGLRAVDLEAIRMLCSQAALAWEASSGAHGWTEAGIMIAGPGGRPIVNPLVRVERDAVNSYLRFAERFGLDIASRMRLGLMTLAGQSLADALSDDLERP